MLKNKNLTITLAVYTVIFYAVWTTYQLLIAGRIEAALSPTAADLVKEGAAKTILWFVPAIILIRRNREYLHAKEKLFSAKSGWGAFLTVFAFFTFYILLSKWKTSGKIALAENFTLWSAVVYLFVGFNEEIVFRGWLLNATLPEKQNESMSNMLPAMIVNAVMFLLIHFPIWIKNGLFLVNLSAGAWISIPVLSVVFSVCFVKSRNIIIPALLHFWWDFLLNVLS